MQFSWFVIFPTAYTIFQNKSSHPHRSIDQQRYESRSQSKEHHYITLAKLKKNMYFPLIRSDSDLVFWKEEMYAQKSNILFHSIQFESNKGTKAITNCISNFRILKWKRSHFVLSVVSMARCYCAITGTVPATNQLVTLYLFCLLSTLKPLLSIQHERWWLWKQSTRGQHYNNYSET